MYREKLIFSNSILDVILEVGICLNCEGTLKWIMTGSHHGIFIEFDDVMSKSLVIWEAG